MEPIAGNITKIENRFSFKKNTIIETVRGREPK